MTIGRLAKATGTQVETIRFYEREGLMPEGARTDANYRLYIDEHVHRLFFIRQCRLLNVPLDEIRTLLRVRDMPSKYPDAARLLTTHIVEVARRIRDLKRLQAELKDLGVHSAGRGSTSSKRRSLS